MTLGPSRLTAQKGPGAIGLEAATIRLRPGMYVGDVASHGLYHLVYMSLDAVLAGRPKRLSVELGKDDGCVVTGDRQPFSMAKLTRILSGRNRIELTKDPDLAFELLAVSALSERFQVDSWSPKGQFRVSSRAGTPEGPVRKVHPPDSFNVSRAGVRISFSPDRAIFLETKAGRWRYSRLQRRMRELAILNPAMTVRIDDRPTGAAFESRCAGGLSDWVEEEAGSATIPSTPIAMRLNWKDIAVDVAFVWRSSGRGQPLINSFANTVKTIDGGRHVMGFVRALGAALGGLARESSDAMSTSALNQGTPLSPSSYCSGLVAAIAVSGPREQIRFLGPTKTTLGIDGLDTAIADGLAPLIREALLPHLEPMQNLLEGMRKLEREMLVPSA